MSTVVDIRKADNPRDVIHLAVQLLARGELVAIPTETVYALAAHSLLSDSIQKLRQTLQQAEQATCSLAVKSLDEALDFAPKMSLLAVKLARRCWPGPVALAVPVSDDEGLLRELPADVRELVAAEGILRLQVSAHPVVQAILRLMPGPLVTASALPEMATAEQISDRFPDVTGLLIDDGPTRYAQAPTVVQVVESKWEIIESGVVAETTMRRLSSDVYLFVCTGNTCRSPMAEGLFRKMATEKLQCMEDELADRGYVVASAGLAAAPACPPSPEAVKVLDRRGIDLRGHESQALTDRLLEQADFVFTLTRRHRDMIVRERPELADRVKLLSADGTDVSDPIGGGIEEYEKCEREIERHVRAIVETIPSQSR